MIEDIADLRRGRFGRHRGLRWEGATPFRHLAQEVRQIAVVAGPGAAVLARHLACALDAGLLGLGSAEDAAGFEAATRGAHGCAVHWRALSGEPTLDDVRAADLIVTDDKARAHPLSALRPTLVSRASPQVGSIGTDVLVVWDGAEQASRAVRAVRPLLRDARHVRILAARGSDPTAAKDILEEHGIVACSSDLADPASLAASVGEAVEEHGIDLLVAGRTSPGLPAWPDLLSHPACAAFIA